MSEAKKPQDHKKKGENDLPQAGDSVTIVSPEGEDEGLELKLHAGVADARVSRLFIKLTSLQRELKEFGDDVETSAELNSTVYAALEAAYAPRGLRKIETYFANKNGEVKHEDIFKSLEALTKSTEAKK